ncbi:MAG TPA: 50S ribosomal protein L11 methyltransferase [Pyrinomonadaceae bacterium]|nr:50S ribosomal protein L11 methyltransferase [Pyrinomonadaceae bacterium]
MRKETQRSFDSMWYALDITCQSEAAEAVQYALLEAGAAGTEEGAARADTTTLTAYFDSAIPDRERVRAALAEALRIYSLPSSSVRDMGFREVAERDWLAEWKANWRPVEVGSRFLIAPPWAEIKDSSADRLVIIIEPGMAFGTGTHETTRLCLSAIERHYTGGSFLDVGTGTGILAIAAAKMFPTATTAACDTDAEAVRIAEENARLNGVAESIEFRVGTVENDTPSAACVCANLTADVIVPLLPALLNVSCERLILSGILTAQVGIVRAALAARGVHAAETVSDGEWVAVVV